jgi:hypothetical protein
VQPRNVAPCAALRTVHALAVSHPPLPHCTPASPAGPTGLPDPQMSFYKPNAVPATMEGLIKAVVDGDLESVSRAWRPTTRALALSFCREDTCHPLLHAVHRLHVDIVRFLLAEGLSPRQRGTVHPYTGDSFMVSDLQGEQSGPGCTRAHLCP